MSSYMLSPGEIALAATVLAIEYNRDELCKIRTDEHFNKLEKLGTKTLDEEACKSIIMIGDIGHTPEELFSIENQFLSDYKTLPLAKKIARILALENLLGVCHRYSDVAERGISKGDLESFPGIGFGVAKYLNDFKPKEQGALNFFSFLDSFCQMADKWVDFFSDMYQHGLADVDKRLGKRLVLATSYQACDMIETYNDVAFHEQATIIVDRWPGHVFDTFGKMDLDSTDIRCILGMAGVPENFRSAAMEFKALRLPHMEAPEV